MANTSIGTYYPNRHCFDACIHQPVAFRGARLSPPIALNTSMLHLKRHLHFYLSAFSSSRSLLRTRPPSDSSPMPVPFAQLEKGHIFIKPIGLIASQLTGGCCNRAPSAVELITPFGLRQSHTKAHNSQKESSQFYRNIKFHSTIKSLHT